MEKVYGHLDEAVVTKIDNSYKGWVMIETVSARNGVTCHIVDIYENMATLEVGMRLDLEECDVTFDNGRITYHIDEHLRGVNINGVYLDHFTDKQVKRALTQRE